MSGEESPYETGAVHGTPLPPVAMCAEQERTTVAGKEPERNGNPQYASRALVQDALVSIQRRYFALILDAPAS